MRLYFLILDNESGEVIVDWFPLVQGRISGVDQCAMDGPELAWDSILSQEKVEIYINSTQGIGGIQSRCYYSASVQPAHIQQLELDKCNSQIIFLTFSVKTSTCANNVDPDESARNKPSHQNLHCLPFHFFFLYFSLKPLITSVDKSKLRMEESTSETEG